MELVAFAGVRHFRDHVAVGSVWEIVFNRFFRVLSGRNFDLIGRRNHDFLGHVADDFIHHEHDGNAKLFRKIEGLDRKIEAFLRGVRTERDDLVVAVRSPAGLHHVGLCRKCGKSSGGSTALDVDEDAGRLRHGRVADVLHHERKAGARRHGEGFGAAPDSALQGDGSGQFIFHLYEAAADDRHALGEAFDDLRRGSDRVAGSKTRSSGKCPFAAGVVAVKKMSASKYAARISLHFSPLLPVLWAPAICARRWQNRDSTSRTSHSRCIFLARRRGADDSPWN